MSNPNFYNRAYKLTLLDEQSGKKKEFTQLDIRFSIKKIVLPCRYTAKISILGLPLDEMNDIAALSAYDMLTAAKKFRKRISLEAGYGKELHSVFSGYILMANIQKPPNMWLDMTATNFIDNLDGSVNLSFKEGLTPKDVLTSVLNQMHLTPVNTYTGADATSKRLGPTVINGGWSDVFKKLNDLADWNIYYDNGVVFVVDQPFKTTANSKPRKIDRMNGLLTVRNVDYIGCSVQTYLNPNATLSAYMEVESELIKAANGKYWINSITHEGHFRGNEWFTTYDGIRRKDKEEKK